MRKLLVLLVSLICLSSSTWADSEWSLGEAHFLRGQTQTKIPYEIWDNRILVQIPVNDSTPLTFVLDTGGSNIMSREAAEALHLKTTAGPEIHGAGPKAVTSQRAKVDKYVLGDLMLTHQSFLILDLNEIRTASGFPRLDGLIGYELLHLAAVRIDPKEKTLTLTDFAAFQPPAGVAPIKMEKTNGMPVIAGLINGQPARYSLDTGDRFSLTLMQKFARISHFDKLFEGAPSAYSGMGFGGAIAGRTTPLSQVRLGPTFEIKNVLARLTCANGGYFATGDVTANVGNEILRRFTLTMDYRRRQLYLQPNASIDDPYRVVPLKVSPAMIAPKSEP